MSLFYAPIMTNEEAERILNAPQVIDLEKYQRDRLLRLQARFNAQHIGIDNTPEEKAYIKKVIARMDEMIKDIDDKFFDKTDED